MRRSLLLIAFIIPLSAFAQGDFRTGYIVKSNGDSVAGFVDYRNNRKNAKSCFFRESKKSKTIRYRPEELKAYGFWDDKRYESKSLRVDSARTMNVFFENIVKGSMSLYRHNGVFYVRTKDMIKLPLRTGRRINTEKGTFSKDDYRYIGLLNHLMFDCGLKADAIKYEERGLTNLVQNYNRCMGGAGLVYKQNKPWTRLTYQVFAGVDLSQLTVDGFDDNVFKQSNSPFVSASLDISSPRLNDKTFFLIEASYLKKEYRGYQQQVYGSGTIERTDYFIPVSFLKFPVGVRYNFLSEAQTPYVKIGFVQFVKLKSSLEVLNEYEHEGVVTTEFMRYDLNARNQSGFWVGAGFSKIIKDRFKGFVEFRYERTNGFLGNLLIDSYSSVVNINVLVGLRF